MQDNKIYKVMSKTAIASVLAASLVAPSVTQAADHDLHDGKGNSYTKTDILFDTNLIEDLLFNLKSYQYELGGKLYDFTKVNELMNAGATEETLAQKIEEAGLTPVGDAPIATELKVESVAAINATTIEVALNKTVTAEDGLKFTIDGDLVGASQITYGDKKVTITVAALVDDQQYTVVAKDAKDVELYNTKVAYDFNIPTELKVDSTSVNAVVGQNVSVTYTLVDEDGDAISGAEVRVQAKTGSTVNEQKVLTTDAEGKVTFSYTTIDAGIQTVEAVVISKPTVRKAVSVDWVSSSNQVLVTNPTADGFIVNTATKVATETKTMKYTVKFTDEQGQPIADGKTVYVNLDGLAGATPTTAGKDEFISNSVLGDLYSATLANGDGTAVLEFTVNQAAKITPTFYYAGDDVITVVDDFNDTHARIKAKTVEVVSPTTQKPTFTLELKSGEKDNQNVEQKDGKLNVSVGSAAQFKLTAKDQFGNPFVGTAKLSHNVALDGIASNDTEFGAIQFDIAELDGGYSSTKQTTIDFDAKDTNGDGVVELQASTGAAGDKTKFTVWFDKNANSKLDAGEGVESPEIEFVAAVAPKVATIEASADLTSVAESSPVTYTVTLKGADGKAYDASATNQGVIVKLYKDGKQVDQNGTVKATHVSGLVGSTFSAAGKDLKGTADQATGQFKFTVTPTGGDAGSEYYAVVYVDLNKDGEVQSDETVMVTTPKFNVIQNPDALEVKLTNADSNEFVAGETVDLTLTAKASSAVATKFNGQFDVKVLLAANTGSSDTADKTYIRTVTFKDGVATVAVPAEVVANTDIKVTLLVGSNPAADMGSGATDGDIVVKAGEAVKLGVNVSDELLVTDAYGNTVTDYNYNGVATFTTTDAKAGVVVLDAENKAIIKIESGAVKNESSAAITFADDADTLADTLTITLKDGKEFSITAAK